jgi:hypothetical protein
VEVIGEQHHELIVVCLSVFVSTTIFIAAFIAAFIAFAIARLVVLFRFGLIGLGNFRFGT